MLCSVSLIRGHLHKLFGILHHGRFVCTFQFFYSTTYLYQCGLMDIYFILGAIVQYYFIYCVAIPKCCLWSKVCSDLLPFLKWGHSTFESHLGLEASFVCVCVCVCVCARTRLYVCGLWNPADPRFPQLWLLRLFFWRLSPADPKSDLTRAGWGLEVGSGLDLVVVQSKPFASVFSCFPPLAECFTK